MLETRELLAQSAVNAMFAPWNVPTDIPVSNPITHQPLSVAGKAALNNTNAGKIVSGTDRAGDQWTITVHGPGTVVVTDISPNDGALDDELNTIQLLGTNPHTTYVTGEVTSSPRVATDGTIEFNQLVDTSGVKSIILNGFTLTQTLPPVASTADPNPVPNSQTGIFLYGGVGYLQFGDILAPIDQATNPTDGPIDIIIGDPSTPLTVEPTIKLDSIWNTVFNSGTAATVIPTTPQTTATVNIVVNGVLKGLDFISSAQAPTVDPAQELRALDERRQASSITTYNSTLSPILGAGEEYQYPIVGTTGRTSIQAAAVGNLNVHGSAVNVTVSRAATPFKSSLSGVKSIKSATFGGTADAVGLDVTGTIGKLTFAKGLGNPTGVGLLTNQDYTELGTPANQISYAGNGLEGGQVTAGHIGKLTAGPANTILGLKSTNPNLSTIKSTGSPAYTAKAGNALTNALITTNDSIGKVRINGNLQNSEIKTGFDYPSYAAGLEGTRQPSRIGSYEQNGDLVDSVVSSTYRGVNHQYGTSGDIAGPGKITGNVTGTLYVTGASTPLGNTSYNNSGVGFFARRKKGRLPPT